MKEDSSDTHLLREMQEGSHHAFDKLFYKYGENLFCFAFSILKSSDCAKEVVHEIFIKVWENRTRMIIHTNLRSYLYKAVKNHSISLLRQRKKEHFNLDDILDLSDKKDTTPDAILIENELDAQFTKVFQQLPARAKLAFKLHRVDGLKYTEIAEIMEISVSAVEKNIALALSLLHKGLFPKVTAN